MTREAPVALLTGGSDKPYAFGLAGALSAEGIALDFIGSDELDCPEIHAVDQLRFLNLRGDQREDVSAIRKLLRIALYYARLMRYAATTEAAILHILWNNRIELFDRTVLMLYYRLLGRRIVLTAHNVNVAARNGVDNRFNRWSLRVQYRLCHHIFVHTKAMREQLAADFGIAADRISVIPFGLNDTIPRTHIPKADARHRLGLPADARVLLLFGQIAPYKGVEHLVEALAILAASGDRVHVVIAGKIKRGHETYWAGLERRIEQLGLGDVITRTIGFVPDDQVEPYFAAADAVVIPYVSIFQSGVPFLAFSFGLPVIATDVGSLREDVTPETGRLCRPQQPADLARAITDFYRSDLYLSPAATAVRIRQFAVERHSWSTVARTTAAVYATVLGRAPEDVPLQGGTSRAAEVPSTCRE